MENSDKKVIIKQHVRRYRKERYQDDEIVEALIRLSYGEKSNNAGVNGINHAALRYIILGIGLSISRPEVVEYVKTIENLRSGPISSEDLSHP